LLEAADVGSIARRTKTEGIDDPLLSVPGIGAEKSKLFLGWTPQSLRFGKCSDKYLLARRRKFCSKKSFLCVGFGFFLEGEADDPF